MSEEKDKLENFERAFSSGTGGCRRTCNCGIAYFEDDPTISWEPGELEKLRATAIELNRVSDIDFEGNDYVSECECWHERAIKIMDWLDLHAHSVAEYLSLEKQRKFDEAAHAPTVREPEGKK